MPVFSVPALLVLDSSRVYGFAVNGNQEGVNWEGDCWTCRKLEYPGLTQIGGSSPAQIFLLLILHSPQKYKTWFKSCPQKGGGFVLLCKKEQENIRIKFKWEFPCGKTGISSLFCLLPEGFGHTTALGGSWGREFGNLGIWVGNVLGTVGKGRVTSLWNSSTFPALPCPIPRFLMSELELFIKSRFYK